MKDTPEEVAELHRTLLLQRSGEERLRMGCEMFDTARALVRAGLVSSGAGRPGGDLRVELLRRTYGRDLAPEVLMRVEERLAAKELRVSQRASNPSASTHPPPT